MSLLSMLRPECVQVGTSAADKESVLREIASIAKRSDLLAGVDENSLCGALSDREKVGTTGFGNRVAIPHCALDGLGDFVVGLLIAPGGVPFDSLDAKPAKVLAFIVGPREQRKEHIHLLSGISRVLNREDAVDELLAARNPEAARESFLRHVVDQVEGSEQAERVLMHAFVQLREKFEDILQVFSEIDGISASVIEAADVAYYLNALPLFAGFLSEDRKGYNRLIIAVVPKALANEVVRRIGTVTGDLGTVRGVMVTVQEMAYSAGTLEL